MRRPLLTAMGFILLVASVAMQPACSNGESKVSLWGKGKEADGAKSTRRQTERPKAERDVAEGQEIAEASDAEVEELAKQSEEHARKMAAAVDRSAAPPADAASKQTQPVAAAASPASGKPKSKAKPVEVKWIEQPTANVGNASVDDVPVEASSSPTVAAASPVQTKEKPITVSASPTVANTSSSALTRRDILMHLADDIRASDDPATVKTTRLAALALFDPALKPTPEDMAKLEPTQRAHVERLQKALGVIAERLEAGDPFMQPDQLAEDFRRALGEQPLRIRNLQLCRRVKGFGIYESFENSTFLAGREQPVIAYVEIENFHSEKNDTEYSVKLTQELTLYNESDGLAVWQQQPVEIVDRSRNERRDFFVVQLVKLPARLTVGKYRLKIRMTDTLGGSIDETSVPLQIVADPAMVMQKP